MHWNLWVMLLACQKDAEKQANVVPTIQIDSHSTGAQLLDGYPEVFRANVSDDNHPTERLEVSWSVDSTVVCDWAVVDVNGISSCAIALSEGSAIVTAEVRDPRGASSQDSVALTTVTSETTNIGGCFTQ